MKFELRTDDDDDSMDWDYGDATVVRVNPDGTKTEIGWIGSEPEDNTYFRAYSWIVPALNEAFELGRQYQGDHP